MKFASQDIKETAALLPLAFHFAWGDTKARYRRSVLGPFWIVLGTAIGVAGLGYLWSIILKIDPAILIPSLTTGMVIWQMLTGVITEACSTFPRYSQIIKNIRTPFIIFPVQLLFRHIINFAHNLVIVIIALLIYVRDWSWVQLLFFPNFLLVSLNLLWIGTLLSIVGARFRDLELFVGAVMPMLFFLSPVIYRPEHLPLDSWILRLNPLAYFIEAIRDPLLGTVPGWHVYVGLVVMAVSGWGLTVRLLESRYGRIAFWI